MWNEVQWMRRLLANNEASDKQIGAKLGNILNYI